jgi:hypothetical protein
MKWFELPVVHHQMSVADAIEEMIEAGTSGLLVRGPRREFRVVDFDQAVVALDGGIDNLHDIEFRPVLDLEANAEVSNPTFFENALKAEGKAIAFVGEKTNLAQLFSTSEGIAEPLASISAGVRCRRPNCPPSTPPRKWYHYYPPTVRDSYNPNRCRVCGSYVP